MKIKQWEIWWADVKFEESDEIKRRPVLVINPQKAFVMSLKMTGTCRGDNSSEYVVREWKKAGLSKPTFIRLKGYLKLYSKDFHGKIGTLDPLDIYLLQLRLNK